MDYLEKDRIPKIRIRRQPRPTLNQIEALSEQELITEIIQLRKHIHIVRNIKKDLYKIPVYDKNSHEEVIERYQLMKQEAIYELKDYISALRRNYQPKTIRLQSFHQ